MPKKAHYDYFDTFIRQVEFACRESAELVALMEDFRPEEEGWARGHLDSLHRLEHDADDVTHDIVTHLAVEFMPPIDREDVSELCQTLDDVCDSIEEIVQHLYMYDLHELHPNAVRVAHVIDENCQALLEAVKYFREFKKPKKLGRLLEAVHAKESEGDVLYMESKRDLFTNHANDPVPYLLGWNSMFTHMEQCCDVCERAASLMQTIALKNT